MSFQNPAFRIERQSVVGHEPDWVKHFDPPRASLATPDEMRPTNPVPDIMALAGLQDAPDPPHTVQRDLMHGDRLDLWDGGRMEFFLFRDGDNDFDDGHFPGATIRVPRGVIFHAETQGHGPPPHTIHWHGIEPTPMNDGVGHCSFEIGRYTYQWQPNAIGTYFYHCHRNTVQHFEFGLYALLIVHPPDAFFATQQDPSILIGACRDGRFRTAANLERFPHFAGFNSNPLDTPDPEGQFPTDPHAMTVPYDIEALWVLDDRDSVWAELADGARDTFPEMGDRPGFDDNFFGNAGGDATGDFFAFNDFNADYWYVTGVPVPAHRVDRGGTGVASIPDNVVVPRQINGGISGVQIPVSAQTGQTVLVRCLDAAYNTTKTRFPIDVVVIAWDGRALGVAPFGRYNHAYKVSANDSIKMSTGQRFDALIRPKRPGTFFAEVEFLDTRRGDVGVTPEMVLMTARIPITVVGDPIVDFAEISADTAVATSVEASRTMFPNGADTVVIATADNWPDALAAPALVGALGAMTPQSADDDDMRANVSIHGVPLLLTDTEFLPTAVEEEIDRLGASHAVVLGGPRAVAPRVRIRLNQLLGGHNVTRIFGDTRYNTAVEVARQVVAKSAEAGAEWDGTIVIASGEDFADAVTVGALTHAAGWPVLLTTPGGLHAATVAAIGELGAERAVVIGGEAAVSAAVRTRLDGLLGPENVTRIAGASRFDTAAEIARFAVAEGHLDWRSPGVANGFSFPEAIIGAIMQGELGSPLLTTPADTLHPATASALEEAFGIAMEDLTFFGDLGRLSAAVRDAIRELLGQA